MGAVANRQMKGVAMAMVDVSLRAGTVAAHMPVGLSDQFAKSLRSNHFELPVDNLLEDDVFCAKRLKLDRLPEIQSCQSSIFRELRHREEMRGYAVSSETEVSSEPHDAGLKSRLFRLFSTH